MKIMTTIKSSWIYSSALASTIK